MSDHYDPVLDDPASVALTCIAIIGGIEEEQWTHGPPPEIGLRLYRLRELESLVHQLAVELNETLAGSMETDRALIPGVGWMIRSEKSSSAWRFDGAGERMRDDLANAVATSVAVDIATGEIDEGKRNVAMQALRYAYEAIPSFSTLKQAARQRFGLRLGDYRSYSTSYHVTVEAVEERN